MVFMVIVFIIVIAVLVVWFATKSNDSGDGGDKGARTAFVEPVKTSPSTNDLFLQKCRSNEDIVFQPDQQQRQIINAIEQNRAIIEEAKRKGYIKTSTAWTTRYRELSNTANMLQKNLEAENATRLNSSKFRRYTSLWHRSVICADYAYEDYVASKETRNEIGELLVAIGKGDVRVSRSEKNNLYTIKDACKESTRNLYDRMIAIENNTAMLREKIKMECGKQGKEWYDRYLQRKWSKML
jgi:hypothetical protein